MRELALDGEGDLQVDSQGRLVVVDGAAAVAQRIQVRLRTLRGEWVFDQTLGTPLFGAIVGGRPNLEVVRTILSQRIAQTEGVERIIRLDLSFSRSTRALTVTGAVQAERTEGEVVFTSDLEVAA